MTEWHNLEHAYGSAEDIPAILETLVPDEAHECWNELWSRLCHQGTVYSASYFILPHLVKAALDWPLSERNAPISLAACICASTEAPKNREEMLSAFSDSIQELRKISLSMTGLKELAKNDYVYALQNYLALSGDTFWGRILDHFASEEFPGLCPNCESFLYIPIGSFGNFVTHDEWVNRDGIKKSSITPATPECLPPPGDWLYEKCISTEHHDLANRILHLFGKSECTNCGANINLVQILDAPT